MINVEMMFVLFYVQLLVSKYKVLLIWCNIIKLIYDKEWDIMVKNINIEKRMMERKRSVFLKRKLEIVFKCLLFVKSDFINQ